MSLVEQSLWWLVPYALLTLLMLHAMMEFTVSLLVQRPQPDRKPIAADQLRRRLLAVNASAPADPLVQGQDCDLEIRWQLGEIRSPGRLAVVKAGSSGCVRLLLDEPRYELRMNQISRSHYFFFGLAGWLPRLSGFAGFQSGPPGHPMARELGRIANRGGWSVRPVLWWLEATHRGHQWLGKLTPRSFRRWPARRFWGILYPLSYVLAIGYLVVVIGSLEQRDWLLVAGISTIWWVAWGFLAWMLCGFPRFWRRRGSTRK